MKPFVSILFASIVTLGTAGAFASSEDTEQPVDSGCMWVCCNYECSED